ncbi:MAG: DUF5666 domain-containing protein [Piscinibacter sp.]|uniref:DUF5666 domain-containing protein n=1 Tax=Piscinibacter sp. TaxID=1903157 RepID=UPI003D12ED97
MNPTDVIRSTWLRWGGALMLALAAVVAGCGGSVGVGGTGSYASAPIEGFGSIYVGGIKYDDSTASVVDEDGAPSSRGALGLGMTVEVEGGAIGGTEAEPTAVANRIRTVSEIVGPASAVDAPAGTLVVFDQTVVVDAFTVFDASFANGLAGVPVGSNVEVFGSFDAAASRFLATRIAPRAGTLAAYKVRGPVNELDTTARTFRIGTALFSYDGAPPLLAEGAYLRVQTQTQAVAGRWPVSSVDAGVRPLPDLDRIKLRGAITRYASDADFDLNGQRVDARTASFIGRPGDLALGKVVVVDGASAGGVLVASKVRLDERGGSQGSVTLQGAIGTLDTSAQTFVLRGSTVEYGGNGVQFDGGDEDDLANGRAVTVRGNPTAGGTRITARRITFN